MQLVFTKPYLSVTSFSPVEIPHFVVLTGVNGAGKSHLLTAIAERHVVIKELQNAHIVLFNYETFRLENEPRLNAQQLSAEREQAWNYFTKAIKHQALAWRKDLASVYEDAKAACKVGNRPFLELEDPKIREYAAHLRKQLYSMGSGQHVRGIAALAEQIQCSLDEVDHDTFHRLYKPLTAKNNLLLNALGKIFWDYYVKFSNNKINEYQNEKHGTNYTILSETAFIAAHGRPPWDVINEILATFDTLKYRVASPEGADYFGNYQLRLQHIEKPGLEIDFSNLSSGERVMMALVACVYKSSTDKLFPDLLLLDEVDASLHPSMMNNMLDVIERVFIKQAIKVILVTHSPTTLALAPEESIYVMYPSGQNRIQKKPKAEALSILTQGFVTIDQGLRLLDQIARADISIITEGHNTALIRKALELSNVANVSVVSGVEGVSGASQLRTIFHFFSKTSHQSKVLVVWDCDVAIGLTAQNNTFPFVLPRRIDNLIARKGIENAFHESLFATFSKVITFSNGATKTEFDESRKGDFASYVISRDTPNDFSHFSCLIEEIERIRLL